MKCIYCRKNITECNKSKEHVFPKSFGCPDTWTIDCVCSHCNNDFGKTIDRYLAGDSMEGLWRLQKLGSRSKKPIRQTRIKLNIPDENRCGEFAGVIVYADFSKKDTLLLPPQILVTDSKGNREFFLIDDIEKDDLKKELQGKEKGFWVFAQNADERRIAIEKLKRVGVEFQPIKEIRLPTSAIESDGKLEVIIQEMKDQVIFRAIAKIVFNYLAKVRGADYALDTRFDTVREYIRNGLKPSDTVKIEKGHILAEETSNKYFFEGHIFTIQTKGNDIIGKVSLSNTFSFYYIVKLGEMGPIWYDLKSGHAYNLKEDRIVLLFAPTFLAIRTELAKTQKLFDVERK